MPEAYTETSVVMCVKCPLFMANLSQYWNVS
jgi:hypothetical protein